MSQNPLAHLQRKKPAKSYHEKYVQLPYLEDEILTTTTANETAPSNTPLEVVASRKPVMIDKTHLPFDRKRVLENLAKRGSLAVRPSLREVPREPFPVGAMEPLEGVEEVEEQGEEETPPIAPSTLEENPEEAAAPEPSALMKKLRTKKVPAKKSADKKRIEKWISEKEGQITKAPLPPTVHPPNIHRISKFYLNNRKKFLTEINHLFSKYRKQMAEKESKGEGDVSCQTQKEKGAFELMTHQKVITDYLNLYSPYRGLLLYHGLGSGKCHKKDTPLLMYDGTIKKVQDVQVGDCLMGDDSTPRTVLSLASGRDAMYEITPTTPSFIGKRASNSGVIGNGKYTVNREHILCLKAVGYPKLTYIPSLPGKAGNYTVEWIENSHYHTKTFNFHSLSSDSLCSGSSNDSNDYESQQIQKREAEKFIQHILNEEWEERLTNLDNTGVVEYANEKVIEISVEDYLNVPTNIREQWKGYRVAVEFEERVMDAYPYDAGYQFGFQIVQEDVITKKIPDMYKCNSRCHRLSFLEGFMDAHGYEDTTNTFHIRKEKVTEGFIHDMVFLIRSLGFSCDFFCDLRANVWVLKLGETLDTELAVDYMGEDEYYGFTLNGNGRYLMGDFTVTHNTCSSIALAEGMKSEKKVFVLTPASLKVNYFNELKNCGDKLYRIHQYWEFVSTEGQTDRVETLAETLQLPRDWIEKHKGAWMMNPNKSANYETLNADERLSLDSQISEMIYSKYEDIHYNGLNAQKMAEFEARGKRAIPKGSNRKPNPFHDCVVVVDEAHNLVSRIHNQLRSVTKKKTATAKEKLGGAIAAAATNAKKTGVKIALKLYEWLMTAENARVILLSGTPIINYPSEMAVMFNILRGVIKTWTFPLKVETQMKVDKDAILNMFERAGLKTYDYVAYGRNELVVTRNPFGFVNRRKSHEKDAAHQPQPKTLKKMRGGSGKRGSRKGVDKKGRIRRDLGVQITPLPPSANLSGDKLDKELESAFEGQDLHAGGGAVEDDYDGVERSQEPLMNDDEFEQTIVGILNSNGLKVEKGSVRVQNHLLLPDNQELFMERFVDVEDGSLKNEDALKRRILGLTSYFRSAQEKLMPAFVLTPLGGDSGVVEDSEKANEEETADADAEVEELEEEGEEAEAEAEAEEPEAEEIAKQMGGMITTNRIYHLVKTSMTPYQFGIYEKIRKEEANQDKNRRKRAKNQPENAEGKMDDFASSYRIFSRVACNFVFPPPGRPMPMAKEGEKEEQENEVEVEKGDAAPALKGIMKKGLRKKAVGGGDGEYEGDSGSDSDSDSDWSAEGGAPAAKKPAFIQNARVVSMMEVGEEEDELHDDDLETETETGLETETGVEKETSQKAYQRAIQTALALLKNNGDKFMSIEALKDTYSPKMAAMIERLQDPENRGLHLIYSQFRSLEGIQIMKLALEQNGWAEFRIQRGSGGDWELDWDVERHGEWKPNTKPCFVLYTGTETAEVKEIIRNIYNGRWTVVPPSLVESLREKGEDNRMGEVIKAFMITSSGAEGISLTNTRYVHIMEPYWNLVRLEQVIGRARRICSHEGLPEDLRTVKVFLYLSVLSDEQKTSEKHIELRIRDVSRFDFKTPVTTDEYLLEVALKKDSINRQILRAIQSTAIDCSLYSDSMNDLAARSGEEALVCYGFGRVVSNAFSSYPTLEEDLTVGETAAVNERREKVAVVEFKYDGEEYVKNLKNGEIYTRANYNRGMETGEDLVVVGKMVRGPDGKERVVLGTAAETRA